MLCVQSDICVCDCPLLCWQVNNYFVATGMNSKGIAGAGGVGRSVAEWIVDGQPSVNLWAYDVRRFIGHHNNKRFLRDRMQEAFGEWSSEWWWFWPGVWVCLSVCESALVIDE